MVCVSSSWRYSEICWTNLAESNNLGHREGVCVDNIGGKSGCDDTSYIIQVRVHLRASDLAMLNLLAVTREVIKLMKNSY
jgi:hypothetical protein